VIDVLYRAILDATKDPRTKALLMSQGDIDIRDGRTLREKIAQEGQSNANILRAGKIDTP
jgi:hypothetical protein